MDSSSDEDQIDPQDLNDPGEIPQDLNSPGENSQDLNASRAVEPLFKTVSPNDTNKGEMLLEKEQQQSVVNFQEEVSLYIKL